MKFQNIITINAPIEETFAFVADLRHLFMWNYAILDVVQILDDGPEVGARYQCIRKPDEQRFEIVEYELNRRVAFVNLKSMDDVTDYYFHETIEFEEIEDGVKLIDTHHVPVEFSQYDEDGARDYLQKLTFFHLQSLKQLLETGQVTLKDGRVVTLK